MVEDDDDVRAQSVESLRELGYAVHRGADGPAALRVLEQQQGEVDLLFTDVVLPGGMSGAQLAAQATARMARAEGAVHHRLRAQRDRPPWPARHRRAADHEAVLVR